LALTSQNRMLEILTATLGADASSVIGMAELLRHEISARGSCQRSAAIGRVQRLAAPAVKLSADAVGNVCDALEREGDMVLAAGGKLVSAPVRSVDLGKGAFRIFSSLPSSSLKNKLPGQWLVDGVQRTCSVPEGRQSEIIEAVEALRGVVLPPAAWAGFDRMPAADSDWLESLDRRLEWNAKPAGSLERDGVLVWSAWELRDAQFGWRTPTAETKARLWRAVHPWWRWVYAYTEGQTPNHTRFLKMMPDEGIKTCYALSRNTDNPNQAVLHRDGDEIEIEFFIWLPVAEYRFLSVSAAAVAASGGKSRWRLPASRIDEVIEVLKMRLGLQIMGEHKS